MDTVTCPGCGEENPAKFRLCGFCGTPLAPPESVLCPSCGEENPGRFRLCGYCGTSLQGAAVPGGAAPGGLVPGAVQPGPDPGGVGGQGAAHPGSGSTLPGTPGALGGSISPSLAPPSDRFPSAGGAPAAPIGLGSSEVRKPATFIFVDLKGSTALTERIDQEAMNEIKKRYFTVMAAQIEQHGGTIEKYIGDAIMAVFGIPRAHEDDALRAVRAAHGMQQELVRLNEDFLRFYGVELANRTGVNTGEVVANTDPSANQQLATGDTVNVAARLEQAAPANEILIGETTYDLVRAYVTVEAVEPLELKGKSERVGAYRLVTVADHATETPSDEEGPLVGRETELAGLRAMLREAAEARACRMATVLGDAGVGKSRLIREFLADQAEDARTLRGRCLPYGDGITFWPIAEVTRMAAGITDEDAPETARGRLRAILEGHLEQDAVTERVAAAIGLATVQVPVSEIFWGVRKLLEHLAADRPTVILIDDIHTAEPTFLELIEHLIDTAEAPILLLCTARNELLERRPAWAKRPGAQRLELAPLDHAAAEAFVDRLLEGRDIPTEVRARIVAAAEGNPLYVEQMVSMLVDRHGAMDTSDLAVPPSIQALLAARLDALSREERAVVEPASVIGLVFPEPAVQTLAPDAVRVGVPGHLASLGRKQFVRPLREAGPAAGEEAAYRFQHLLIRDTAYGSLLKRARATLHERFVAWAEPVNRERGREQEFEEILGYHLEQAYRYRSELGPLDEDGRSVGRRGADKLANAGRRAFGRGDMPAAASLLARAAALLPEEDPTRIELLPDLAEALMERGEFGEAAAVAADAQAAAERIGDARLAARALLARAAIDLFAGTGDGEGTIIEQAQGTLSVFERAEDQGGLARAHRLLMVAYGTAGQYEDAARCAERTTASATAAGDRRMAARGAAGYATVALLGPNPVPDVIERCEALLGQVGGDRKAEAVISGVLAQLYAMQGDFEPARERYRRSRALIEDLGPSVTAASTSTESARVEILAGDLVAAERELRRDLDALESMGERYFRSTVAAMLAGVLVDLDRTDEADAMCSLAEELTEEDDVNSEVLWRSARARLLSVAGSTDAALEQAQRAVTLAAETVDIDLQGDTHATMAEILQAAGRPDEARAAWTAALERYERKADRVSAGRAQARLEDLSRSP